MDGKSRCILFRFVSFIQVLGLGVEIDIYKDLLFVLLGKMNIGIKRSDFDR